MKKIVLLLCVAALSAVALYFSLSSRSAEQASLELPGAAAHATGPDAPVEPAPAAAVEAAASQAPAPLASESRRETRARDFAPEVPAEKRCTLVVRMELPRGTPGDDETEFVVLDKLPDETNVAGELALLGPSDAPPKWLLARAAFDADRPTEIQLERRKRPVGVGLHGRYTFAEPQLSVDVSGERAEITFTPGLGARIAGQLVPPADATERERELLRSKVHLDSDPMAVTPGAPSPGDRDTLVAADGSCESRGAG